jgi:hypothetical protein
MFTKKQIHSANLHAKTGVLRYRRSGAGVAVSVALCWASPVMAADYHVDGEQYDSIEAVPWSEVGGGDTVYIHWRSEPYRESFGIEASGDSWDAPIRISGVAGPDGSLPVVDGSDAQSGPGAHPRGLISVRGGSEYIVIENLEVRGANQGNGFPKGSSSIYAENGSHLLFNNLTLTDSDNGFFSAPETADLIIRGCTIYGNGVEGSIYEHNSYTESNGILFEFNTYGLLRTGALGNNLKDRSAHMVVRYNWIDGGNRPLDLVEPEYGQGEYGEAAANDPHFVYGNVLLKRDDGTSNDQVVHFGGDGSGAYRRFLYFYHNTIYSTRGSTSVFLVNVDNANVDARNNVIHTREAASSLRLFDSDTPGSATLSFRANYIIPGHGGSNPSGFSEEGTVEGSPAFRDEQAENFYPGDGSSLLDGAVPLASEASAYPVEFQFVGGGSPLARTDTVLDIGAFEACDPDCGAPAPSPTTDVTSDSTCVGAGCSEPGPTTGQPGSQPASSTSTGQTGPGGASSTSGGGGATTGGNQPPVSPPPTPGGGGNTGTNTPSTTGTTSGSTTTTGLSGDAGDQALAPASEKSDCSCRLLGAPSARGASALWALAFGFGALQVRRRRSGR